MLKKYLSIVVIAASFTYIYACDANCVACHPKLIKNGKMDDDHKILNRCTRCHTAKENEESHSACGADCWRCHDIRKVGKIDVQSIEFYINVSNVTSRLISIFLI